MQTSVCSLRLRAGSAGQSRLAGSVFPLPLRTVDPRSVTWSLFPRFRDGRVLGVLEVSRSIGDGQYKRCGVTSVPDIRRCQLTPNDRYVAVPPAQGCVHTVLFPFPTSVCVMSLEWVEQSCRGHCLGLTAGTDRLLSALAGPPVQEVSARVSGGGPAPGVGGPGPRPCGREKGLLAEGRCTATAAGEHDTRAGGSSREHRRMTAGCWGAGCAGSWVPC